jgi:hypothetical protein
MRRTSQVVRLISSEMMGWPCSLYRPEFGKGTTLFCHAAKGRYNAGMTEAEWLGCNDPIQMLDFLKDKSSDRKLRLFSCACCYRIGTLFPDGPALDAVRIAERYADGVATEAERLMADKIAQHEWAEILDHCAYFLYPLTMALVATGRNPWQHLSANAAEVGRAAASEGDADEAQVLIALHQSQPALIHDIFGSPFRATMFDPTSLTPAVIALAHTIYEEREFERMPELADELEKAGCTNADVLEHCRGPGPHVRGCWVLDLLIGKR